MSRDYVLLTFSLITLLFTSLSYASKNDEGDDKEIAFEIIATGGQSGVDHQMSMVVDSQMHWEHIWKMNYKGINNPPPLPKIDFNNEVVITQFLGPVASCGYDIYTEEVEDKGDYIKVETIIQLPEGEIQCLIAEQPYEMIKISRTNVIVQFKQDIDDD